MGSLPTEDVLDALIVGAGFAGVYQLKRLREEGYKVKLVDSASDYGGVWYWNRYPGAGVDSTVPHYEFSDPTLWKEWTWSQRFPGSAEIREYFAFVAQKWDLRRDTEFSTHIASAKWHEPSLTWVIKSSCGKEYRSRFFLLNTGFAARRYIPDWKGIDSFQGTFVHPSYWPKEEPDLRGKKVAVIGNGSTGVQIAQELSQVAEEFVLFQRTPNTALPQKQINFKDNEHERVPKETYPAIYAGRTTSFGGFDFNFLPRNTFSDTPEQRQQVYETLWQHGDFRFHLGNYQDLMFSAEANEEAYAFWRDKVRARIHDPALKELLAPQKNLYHFGCKRIPLEINYFEMFNQPNVSLVDVNATPIERLTPRGIQTTEKEWEFDYIVCATGYDSFTGGLKQIDIEGAGGADHTLAGKWKAGTKTYLGMSVSGFPNMFFTYGPQAPTALCNGPTCAESQGEFLVSMMNHLAREGRGRIEAGEEGEAKWGDDVRKFAYSSLLPGTKSWYMGDNIPGKPREPLIYLGGVPNYYNSLKECAEQGYAGFAIS
ncbi:FAD/NAD(P)-binding domain-containing protein [Aspergillus campestris IBT 28561]|uniref:FAD/NAD(P)-binding domain-containing protein n=1 Tax=Aspergillus campestris (strain IBT 28561) TaxID=1392248 RepID=A0A2I1DGZ4_ASPC2|nr:FAD/NAD(P)-binding domain-containing protein [Aspergillus campestris IBT 28561]PKY09147.1 FAD/NAD(P)-binding domain-containing protein [Aspergillus campestris IBT 28561]